MSVAMLKHIANSGVVTGSNCLSDLQRLPTVVYGIPVERPRSHTKIFQTDLKEEW